MADRSRLQLPGEYESEVTNAGLRVDAALPTDFGEAAQAAREELRLLRAAEAASGRDLHKGHPLYNLGVTLYPRQPREARRHFEAAFVEDVRTYKAPRQRLAARVIRNLLKAPRRILRELSRRATPNVSRDPLEVADEVDSDFDLPTFEPLFPENQPDDWLLEVASEELVFVGGSYGLGGDRIFQIAGQVASCGLRPVIVGLLKRRPGESDRQKSFRVLDLCSLAAFDGTVQERPGWWAEVERIINTTRIPTLIVFYASRSDHEYRTSAMFPTPVDHPELTLSPFGTNLPAVVAAWLRHERGADVTCDEDVAGDGGSQFILGSNTPFLVPVPSGYPSIPLTDIERSSNP